MPDSKYAGSGLSARTYIPEQELEMVPNEGSSPRYPGLTKQWQLYPVDLSFTEDAFQNLNESGSENSKTVWLNIDEILEQIEEPNVPLVNLLNRHL